MDYIKETKRRMGFLETNPSCGSCKHFRDREAKQGSIKHEGSCKYSRTCSFGVEKKYYCSRYSPSREPEDLSDQDVANLSYEELIEILYGNPEEEHKPRDTSDQLARDRLHCGDPSVGDGEARPKSLSDQDIRNIMHPGHPLGENPEIKAESPKPHSEDSKRFYIEVPADQALAWDESQERITELEKALAYISEQEGCTAIGAFAEGKLKKEGRC